MDREKLIAALAGTWPVRAVKSGLAALQLPGDVYQGNVSMWGEDGRTNPEVIERSADLGGIMAGGSLGAIPENALGSGAARMRMIENVDLFKELANQQRAKGFATGKAAPGHDFKRPDAAKGSWERLLAETNAKWAADKDRAMAGYHDAAPSTIPPPTNSPHMTKADWEFIRKNGGLAVPLIAGGAAYGTKDNY